MAKESELINRSNTICHYKRFSGFLEPNCNGCNAGDSKMVEILHLFAESGLTAVVNRERDEHGQTQDWVLVTTSERFTPAQIRSTYELRPAIEERHRQYKCFWYFGARQNRP